MSQSRTAAAGQQAANQTVRGHFNLVATEWEEVYERHDVEAVIYQERRAAVLSHVASLALARPAAILEVGCGAGSTAVALARLGHAVTAMDVSESMLRLTCRHAGEDGVGHLVRTNAGDVRRLPFKNGFFDVVIAVGVLPWLPSLPGPLREMSRVLRVGGHLIVTMDNRLRLTHILHPFAWARIVGLRVPEALRVWDRHRGSPHAEGCSVRAFDSLLAGQGLRKVMGHTLGFGPFWMLNRIVPGGLELKLHQALQARADKGAPLLRSAGVHYIAVSRKMPEE